MKKQIMVIVLALLLISFGSAEATIIGGPAPLTGYGVDDGSIEFIPSDAALSLEYVDYVADYNLATSFGFYFVSDPSNPVVIFGPEDQPTSINDPQVAIIDFLAGRVYDFEDMAVQSIFTPTAGNIGFFYAFDQAGDGSYIVRLNTDPVLNSGFDVAATFPSIADPSAYLIGFEIGDGNGGVQTLSLYHVSNITPVPEPGTLALLGMGLLGIGGASIRKKS